MSSGAAADLTSDAFVFFGATGDLAYKQYKQIDGDASLFVSDGGVEAAWRVVEPILGGAAPLADYEPGTWGPATARAVVASEQGWHDPKREDTAPC
jgi:glucose-6-phosphate 1-dehydrogenase